MSWKTFKKKITSAILASSVLWMLTACQSSPKQPSGSPTSPSDSAPGTTPNQEQEDSSQSQTSPQDAPTLGSAKWRGSGGWGHNSQYGKMYDPNLNDTISGEVVSTSTFTPIGGMVRGVHLQVKTENETVDVHLGPAWYIENQDISIETKDKIEVTGSRITFEGTEEPVIIAASVKKGDTTLELRDEKGFPVWSGWRGNHLNR